MEEIIQGMERALPEPSWEEIDQWLSCHNQASTIPDWYERAEEFTLERLTKPSFLIWDRLWDA